MKVRITDKYALKMKIRTKKGIIEALNLAKKMHINQKRKYSGKPYIVHPLKVMNILLEVTQDKEILQAALLHDTIEDTPLTYKKIRFKFGKRVADLVQEVTNDNNGNPKIKTREGLMIKLADMLHNISDNKDKRYIRKKIRFIENINISKKGIVMTKNRKKTKKELREEEIRQGEELTELSAELKD